MNFLEEENTETEEGWDHLDPKERNERFQRAAAKMNIPEGKTAKRGKDIIF